MLPRKRLDNRRTTNGAANIAERVIYFVTGKLVETKVSEVPAPRNLTSSMPKRCAAEFLGTFALVFAGAGAMMVDVESGGKVTQVGIGLSSGLVVAVMVYTIGHISGAHINPAVTAGMALARRFPLSEAPLYWGSQLLGGATASLTLRGLLGNVGDMGATLPGGSAWQSFGLEIVLTFLLMTVVMAVATDSRAIRQGAPIAIGAIIWLETTFAGPISGASMNPARSFSPALVGWVWDSHWIYWAAPLIGAGAASLLYQWLGKGDERSSNNSQPPLPQ